MKIIKEYTTLPRNHPFLQKPHISLTLIEKEARIDIVTTFVTNDQVIRNFGSIIYLKIKGVDQQGLQKVFDYINSCKEELLVGKAIYSYEYYKRRELIWELPVQRMLHDFRNVYLSQIKELNNPSDDKQQRLFSSLVHEYFDHRLSESDSNIEIKSCSFSLS